MSWGTQRGMRTNMVSVDLDFDAVEFIALELPQRDGFTRDWWQHVYMPMVKLREEEAADAEG